MLVLGRRVGERIVIGESIVVHVHAIRGQRVQVAIEAPDRVPIRRAEVLARETPTSSTMATVVTDPRS